MDRLKEAELNLRMINQLTAEQVLRPDQAIRVVYSLEADRRPNVSYHGLYVRHFETEGLWNIELLDLTEIVRNPNRNPFDFDDLFNAAVENTDEAWDSIGRDDIRIDLEDRNVVRWLGDLVCPVFSLY